MVQETALAPKRGSTRVCGWSGGRAFFLREWSYAAIADEEGLTPRRVRQIVSEAQQKRIVDPLSDHALSRSSSGP